MKVGSPRYAAFGSPDSLNTRNMYICIACACPVPPKAKENGCIYGIIESAADEEEDAAAPCARATEEQEQPNEKVKEPTDQPA